MAFTTSATTEGGREGRAILEGNGLASTMTFPKELGGLVQDAHMICPYSRATRSNVPVTLTVV
jgi:organic hydroperoxide reductase OsmC/OhrA